MTAWKVAPDDPARLIYEIVGEAIDADRGWELKEGDHVPSNLSGSIEEMWRGG